MAERGHSTPVKGSGKKFTFRSVQLLKNETLGTGAYGAVCKAKCDQLICAAKLLYPALFQLQTPDPGKEHRQPFHRFEIECLFLSQISHPNIVQYLGTYRDPETNAPVLLMELMDESLTHFLESSLGNVPYHIQVNLSQDIAQALAFLHANGIIHRDLSSNNVLLIAGSRAKVADFGMSKSLDINATHSATMTTCPGTQVFMSPEALDEPPVCSEKLDTFSFGVLLVQISTQKFPKPTDRFRKIEIPDPRNPSHKKKVLDPIPEVERRQTHISLIEPSHPLLPIALECLKDSPMERPSSQQLCQLLDNLKGTLKYEESQLGDINYKLKQLQKQVQEKDEQIQAKNQDLQVLQDDCEAKERELQAKDEVFNIKDELVREKDKKVQFLQSEVEEKENQLRRLNQQWETNVKVTATSSFKDQLHLHWEIYPDVYECSGNNGLSAVIGEKAYFQSGFVYEFNSSSQNWNLLPEHPLIGFSLVSVENELATVGGFNNLNSRDSNKLYSYIKGRWVEKYPPMQTKRWECMTVYRGPILVVAGGVSGKDTPLTTVEILNTFSKRWSNVSSLPSPIRQPSASICGEYIYLHDIHQPPKSKYSVVRCSLFGLAFSTPNKVIWEDVASLQVRGFTFVNVKGHLLAVGGESIKGDRCEEIYRYSTETDSWQVVSQMNIARSHCAAALLQDNKLMVAGGVSSKDQQSIEVATISFESVR